MKKTQRHTLVPVSIFICSFSQIFVHFIHPPDFAAGWLMGVGIGLMILSFIKPKGLGDQIVSSVNL